MDKALLEQPLVNAPAHVRPVTTPAEAARLRALAPTDYWLEIARELAWDRAPTVALEGQLGDFRYYPGAMANVSVNCLDRWPAERVALHYEREDGVTETWTFGRLTDAVARFAAALEDLGVTKGDRVAVYASNVPESFIAIHACYRIGAIYTVIFAGFSASAVRDRLEDAKAQGRRRHGCHASARKSDPAEGDARRGDEGPEHPARRRRTARERGASALGQRARLRGAPREDHAESLARQHGGERPRLHHLHVRHDEQTEGPRPRGHRLSRRRLREREVVARPPAERRLLVHGGRGVAHVPDLRARRRPRARRDARDLRGQHRHADAGPPVRDHGEVRRHGRCSPRRPRCG